MADNFWQLIAWAGSLLGVLSTAFVAGYNWRRITVLEQSLERHLTWTEKERESLDAVYARKDLMGLELTALRSRLDFITQQLSAILGDRFDRRNEPRE